MRVDRALFGDPRRTQVDGHAMAYVEDGDGPPVVCVHGNPTWGFAFRHLVRGLRDSHRVIVPDHIGMGRSERPAPGTYEYRLARRISDLETFLDQVVPAAPVDLVLHDWGGPIGLGWATRHPERVRSALLLNTAAFPLPDSMDLPWMLRTARSRAGRVLVRRLGAFNLGAVLLGPRRLLSPTVMRGYLDPYRGVADRVAVDQFVLDIPLDAGHPSWATLAAVADRLPLLRERPVTICWGMKDPVFTPALLDEWRRRLPGARVVRLPHAGHLLMEDAPDTVLAVARSTFDGADDW